MSTPPPDAADRPRASLSFRVREAAAYLQSLSGPRPRLALVLGSGLAGLADEIELSFSRSFEDIPHFPPATVQGHPGQLQVGHLHGMPVVALVGRLHYYEGYSLEQVTFPIRVMRRLGAEVLVQASAAGGVNPRYSPGDLMLVRDHLNIPGLGGLHPLRGLDEPELGPRFLDLKDAYDPSLRRLARQSARQLGLRFHEGVYAMTAGPTYETAAEVRALRLLGADAVGMSTVPETIVACQEGLRVLAIAIITNSLPSERGVSHAQVLATAQQATGQVGTLLRSVIRQW